MVLEAAVMAQLLGGELAEHSRRAYAADLADLLTWLAGHSVIDIAEVRPLHLYAYLSELRRKGLAPSTIRRRLTLIRKLVALEVFAISEHQLRALDSLPRRGRDAATVLVISDDAIIRAGLSAVLDEDRTSCWADRSTSLRPAAVYSWDYILVWIDSRRGLDPYGAIPRIKNLGSRLTTRTPIVAVHSGPIGAFPQLRLAEAGVRYAVPQSWLSEELSALPAMLSTATVPLEYHLDTPLAMRQRLGLRLSGDLDELLGAAQQVPSIVWTGHLPQSHLPIPRSKVNQLRYLALTSAGIPGPEFSKYATSARRAPDAPAWPRVRDIVRRSFELTSG